LSQLKIKLKIKCYKKPASAPKVDPPKAVNPCVPSPCGANSECRVIDSRAVCSCTPGMFGAPPNCRPECVINSDCPTNLACVRNKCTNPCQGSCGFHAVCTVHNHQPVCRCDQGFEGDPFSGCNPIRGRSMMFLLHAFHLLLFSIFVHLCLSISFCWCPISSLDHQLELSQSTFVNLFVLCAKLLPLLLSLCALSQSFQLHTLNFSHCR